MRGTELENKNDHMDRRRQIWRQEWRQGYGIGLRSMCEMGLEIGFLQSLFKVHQESRLEAAGTGDKYTHSIAGGSTQGSDVNSNGPTCRVSVHGHCR